MRVDVFLDSSVLVHAIDASPDEAAKRTRARELIRRNTFGTSAQAIQEFFRISTACIRKPLEPYVAARWVDRLLTMPFVPTDAVLIRSAIIRSHAHHISLWDGAIIAAAEALSATTLYSEDLNDGQKYGSVTVVNPFK